jgi:Icc-related predicted phosphoesterase
MGGAHCFFVSDLHGRVDRYRKLFDAAVAERPAAILLGGDLLPHRWTSRGDGDFVAGFLVPGVKRLRRRCGNAAPRILLILGNDDERVAEALFIEGEHAGLWEYLHRREAGLGGRRVVGYSYVPPTPFLLKDWERYDVSRFVDPGSVSPEEGYRTVSFDLAEVRSRTIADDLSELVPTDRAGNTVLLAHSPPYRTCLDRAALDGRMVDHVPLDVHVGSVAVRRLIESRQPWLALHGHIHEAPRLTGSWRDQLGRTPCLSAAHDGPELALVRFDLDRPEEARRELI